MRPFVASGGNDTYACQHGLHTKKETKNESEMR